MQRASWLEVSRETTPLAAAAAARVAGGGGKVRSWKSDRVSVHGGDGFGGDARRAVVKAWGGPQGGAKGVGDVIIVIIVIVIVVVVVVREG